MPQLTLGLPKGSLEATTLELFRKSGWKISGADRSYFPSVDDDTLRCVLARPQEMSRYVEDGVLDAGITGKDWTLENDSDVHVVCDFVYSKASMRPTRWVLVVPQASPITTLEQMQGKRIATEMVGFTKRYFRERHVDVDVEFSWGATEAKVVQGLVDAIVEVTETGSTIRANGLKIIHELCQSNPQLVANRGAWEDPWKREKIEQISLLLNGALQAEAKVGLKMNVPKDKLDAIMAMIPSITAPTVSPLYKTEWFAIETVIAEAVVRELIPQLLKNGAVGIIEYPLNKVI
ncbi:ATP phosphoribosyltransferase [bacterium]|nr:ATP phosphoribosyltransferase [bacterium]